MPHYIFWHGGMVRKPHRLHKRGNDFALEAIRHGGLLSFAGEVVFIWNAVNAGVNESVEAVPLYPAEAPRLFVRTGA